MAGKGSSAAKLETRPTVHEFRWEKLRRREEVEASSPRGISAAEEARRRLGCVKLLRRDQSDDARVARGEGSAR